MTSSDFEFLLFDRITKIQSVIRQYGEENFYISFSGGKDSTVLSHLVDMALPDNNIPRVYANTGIELNMVRDFVMDLAKEDKRVIIIKPSVPIKQMLEKEGYPFKSKEHSENLEIFKNCGYESKTYKRYVFPDESRKTFGCPKILKYQFSENFSLKVSDKCCLRMKEEPLAKWAKENNKPYAMLGIMPDEGGRRRSAKCLAFKKNGMNFQPLVVVTKEWEDWFIEKYNVKICDIYYPPYSFDRTGCKGCPFNPHLQKDLDVLERFFPAERKQCELIWGPVYKEYRRIGYRLRKETETNVDSTGS